MVKTNRDILLDTLHTCSNGALIEYLEGKDRCKRCSNHYFDMDCSSCHKYCNHSSCKYGQLEWLESYPDEILQLKYRKQYRGCKDYYAAVSMEELLKMLYKLDIVSFPEAYDSYKVYVHIDKMRTKAIDDQYHKDVVQYPQDSFFDTMDILQDQITLEYYIERYLIPGFEKEEDINKAKYLLSVIYSKD